MNDDDLVAVLDRMKATMIAVATGGPRIGEVQHEFAQNFDEVSSELGARAIDCVLPYRELWDWYGRWSSGDLPSWQSRRKFVSDLFGEQLRLVRSKRTPGSSAEELKPTGWARVDRNVTGIRSRLASATNEEDFQAVGLLCREALISLAQAVFDPAIHPTPDDVEKISETDAKRMLESYISVALGGSVHEHERKHVKAAYDLATHLQHRRTASFREAATCVEATASTINLIAIIAGLRDPT